MGRYINGDIDRKLWFAVQSSNAADRFGVEGFQPEELYYNFETEDLEKVKDELKNIENKIGLENIEKLRNFFENTNVYNNDMLNEAGISEIWNQHKEDYADYELGKEIRDCIVEKGSSQFTAEL